MLLGSTWIDGPLGLMSLIAGMCHILLLASGRANAVPAISHAAMGIGMAAMFVPAADPLPRPVWVVVFAAITAWFAVAALRAGTLLGEAGRHAVGALAMLYMLQDHSPGAVGAMVDEPVHAHHGEPAGEAPALLMTAIALAFVAWFVADIARLLVPHGRSVPTAAAPGPVCAASAGLGGAGPAVLAGLDRHIAVPNASMSAAMAVMFLVMV